MVDGGGDKEHQHDQVIVDDDEGDEGDEGDEDDDGDDTGRCQRTSTWSWTGSVYPLGGDGWMIFYFNFFFNI